mmetsp:Transcript_43739/g.85422  ORF Transcript_43739/g.85422 Transcript_43739/m.85422 type:complete len:505 (+) Transcript_43739:63-1577(+)
MSNMSQNLKKNKVALLVSLLAFAQLAILASLMLAAGGVGLDGGGEGTASGKLMGNLNSHVRKLHAEAEAEEAEGGSKALDHPKDVFPTREYDMTAGGKHWRLPLPTGLMDGSCIEFPLVWKGGGEFRVELRGGSDLDNTSCGYNDNDLIHLHVRYGNAAPKLADKGPGANLDGKGYVWFYRLSAFEDPIVAHPKKEKMMKICIEQKERFVIYTDGKETTWAPLWWDAADISCMTIEKLNYLDIGKVKLSGIPATPVGRTCKFSKCGPTLPPAQPFVGIDKALYINLESRKDRKTHIEGQLDAANIKYIRLPAFNTKEHWHLTDTCWDKQSGGAKVCAGQLGCQRSHLMALERAMEEKWSYVAVFEDDFKWQPWVDPKKVNGMVAELMNKYPDWDVIALSLSISSEKVVGKLDHECQNGKKCEVSRILEAQTTGGYIIRDTAMLQVHHRFNDPYCPIQVNYQTMIDHCWKPLQHYLKFYAFEPQLGTQAAGHSDIEHSHVNYNLT